MLPQTFEDTAVADPLTGKLGDGGPLDVCEISSLGKPTVRRARRRRAARILSLHPLYLAHSELACKSLAAVFAEPTNPLL